MPGLPFPFIGGGSIIIGALENFIVFTKSWALGVIIIIINIIHNDN